jgi:AraC family transcriptional regulator
MTASIRFILDHHESPLKVKELASACFLSPVQFNRLFKERMGTTPVQYLLTVRVRMAAMALLETDASVIEIATSVGFESLSSFNRQFKAKMNMSPRQYRKAG